MSRLLAAIFLLFFALPLPAQAPQLSDAEIDAMIEKQRRQVALDADGCPKYPDTEDGDVIIVCGESEESRSQRIFESEYDPDAIHRGEVDTTRASQCIGTYPDCGHRLHEIYGAGFGYVKPMAVDWDETMRGLPEPDMVVTKDMIEAEKKAAEDADKPLE